MIIPATSDLAVQRAAWYETEMRIEGVVGCWMWLALSLMVLGCRQADVESRPAQEPAAEARGTGAETADDGPSVEDEAVAEPDATSTETAPAEAAPAEGEVATLVPVDPSWPAPPEGMVYIPAADVMLQNDEARSGVRRVEAFFMDRLEVTTAAYEACVSGRRCPRYARPTEVWYGAAVTDDPIERWLASACNYGRPERADHPMNCVAWRDADTFCRARGGSLPTFDQREYAGRGTDQRQYPWGNVSPRGGVYANYKDPSLHQLHADMGLDLGSYGPMMDDGFPETAPVGSFPRDRSPFGVMDMAGNVAEWTESMGVFDRYPSHPLYGQRVPLLAPGSWMETESPLMDTQIAVPSNQRPTVGFRCAAPVTP